MKSIHLLGLGLGFVLFLALAIWSSLESEPPTESATSSAADSADSADYATRIEQLRRTQEAKLASLDPSPIPESVRDTFQGLAYFPPDPRFQLEGRFVEAPATSVGSTADLKQAGFVEFQYGEQAYRLTVFWMKPDSRTELFLPFTDATTGQTTYDGGRYLNLELAPDSTVRVDFNRAYNPYCAYSPDWTCPIPPPENELEFAVEAGEQNFPYDVPL